MLLLSKAIVPPIAGSDVIRSPLDIPVSLVKLAAITGGVASLGSWLLVRLAGIANFSPVKMSLLAASEGNVFVAGLKNCDLKNCAKLLLTPLFSGLNILTVDACEMGGVMLLEVSAVIDFNKVRDVNGLIAANSELSSNGFVGGNKTFVRFFMFSHFYSTKLLSKI